MKRLALAAAVAALAPASYASAQDVSTSKADIKSCKLVRKAKPDEGGNPWLRSCPGKFGYIVRHESFDDRDSISVGRTMKKAAAEPAAKLDFEGFTEADKSIEWRSRGGKPYAIIQRWFVQRLSTVAGADERRKERLVVTRLPPGPVCRVALVDVAGNPDHQKIARSIADKNASSFDCRKPPVRIGAGGKEEAKEE